MGLLKAKEIFRQCARFMAKEYGSEHSKDEGWSAHLQTASMWTPANWWKRRDTGFYWALL